MLKCSGERLFDFERKVTQISAVALLVALLSLSAPAQPLVYYADAGRSDNLGDGRSWATAKRTLQAAIDATTTAHQVWVKAGSYPESIGLRSGVGLYGGFSGNETRLDERRNPPSQTIIDASHARAGQPAYHVVVMDAITAACLDGFKISGGQAYGNSPECNGGGIFCQNLDASTTISHCLITGNTAPGGCGAGIACMTASPVITDCAILNNTAGYSGSNNGGGISCQQSSPLIRRCTIAGNYAYYNGGGLHLQQSAPHLLECTIAANWTQGAYSDNHGGGLYCDQSPAVIERCRISGNSANLDGGGLYLDHCSPAILNCVLSGNAAVNGGAMRCYFASPRIINCTLSDNTAQTSGGAVYCQFECVPVISNTIFSGNAPRAICDLWAYSSVPPTLSRSLFFDNAGGDYCDENGAIHTGANDLNMNVAGADRNIEGTPRFAAGLAGRWTTAAVYDATLGGTRLINNTARLAPGALQGMLINPDTAQKRQTLVLDNSTTSVLVAGNVSVFVQSGDPWKVCDYHLANGSPALDRAALQDALPLDLEGDPRPGSDGRADIGADEAASAFQPDTDTIPPVSELRGAPALAYTTAIDLPFAASDEASGLKAVRLFYRRNGGAWTQYPDVATTFSLAASPVHFNAVATGGEGHYEFYTQATDNAGNTETRPATPDADVVIITRTLKGPRLYVDRDAPGAANGADWANACHEVGTALALAVKFGIPEIWVAAGVYPEHITMASKVAVYGGFQGYGGARETALAQRDPRQNQTTLDPRRARGVAGTVSVVTMDGITSACLDGFTICGGSASGDA